MTEICLVIIYNNNFESNIEIVEKIYEGRFKNIYHLMPFYTGKKENVIKIYGNSYQFQDYITQGLSKFYNEKYSHYVFVSDDVMLNPNINKNTIKEMFKLEDDGGYLPGMFAVNYKKLSEWGYSYTSIENILKISNACEYKNFLPSIEEAQNAFRKYGLEPKNITEEGFNEIGRFFQKNNVNYYLYSFKKELKAEFDKFLEKENKFDTCKNCSSFPKKFVYPMAGAYSDFFIIPSCKIKEFAHICGVFGALRIFAEIAIPTAMILSLEKLSTQKNTSYMGKTGWSKEFKDELKNKYNYSVKTMFENWDNKISFYHPIKLSQWKID